MLSQDERPAFQYKDAMAASLIEIKEMLCQNRPKATPSNHDDIKGASIGA
jgi:hypothetical protein